MKKLHVSMLCKLNLVMYNSLILTIKIIHGRRLCFALLDVAAALPVEVTNIQLSSADISWVQPSPDRPNEKPVTSYNLTITVNGDRIRSVSLGSSERSYNITKPQHFVAYNVVITPINGFGEELSGYFSFSTGK